MRRPDETEPDPPGGRAAERLKEFLLERAPSAPASGDTENDAEKEQEGE